MFIARSTRKEYIGHWLGQAASLCMVGIIVAALAVTLYPLMGNSSVLFSILVLLTAMLFVVNERRVRALRETDRQKDELLSIVSHQLATPISSMRYLLEMWQDGDFGSLTKEQQEQISKLQHSVTNASDLVRMILDVSRIQLGRMNVHCATFNIEHMIDDMLDVVRPRITEKKIKLITTITRPMPEVILDKRLLRMTIENILTNAIKYTPKKGTVWFEATITQQHFYCKVTDTGCGIPVSEQAMLYNKLFRASNVRDTVAGTGFGLYIAKGAIEAQGGTIRFYSKEGEGTTFYAQVPIDGSQCSDTSNLL